MLAHAARAARLMLDNETGVQFVGLEGAAVPARAPLLAGVCVAWQMQALGRSCPRRRFGMLLRAASPGTCGALAPLEPRCSAV